MSRRLEVTVPIDWVDYVKDVLANKDQCNFNEASGKPYMVVEIPGQDAHIFFVTIPAAAVSQTLAILRKSGIGVSVGRVVLTSLEYLKPDLLRPLQNIALKKGSTREEAEAAMEAAKKLKSKPLVGFAHFQKARKTTEELYNEISGQATITVNTWLNLVGASIMAAGGLASNATVFVVAAMLVSPIMGPILGMTFGYRVADWPLFKAGFLNEMKMAGVAFLCGLCYGFVLGDVGDSYNWPTDAMQSKGQAYTLIISIIVSFAAGIVLAVSMTSTGGNALVGSAISAGLLPPIVSAGMLLAYGFTYAPLTQKHNFYEMAAYLLTFYLSHVLAIVVVANIIFWLKDINPHFKEGDDANFNDIPSIVAHKKRLEEKGESNFEKGKAEFFVENIKGDLKDLAADLKEKTMDVGNLLTFGLIPGLQRPGQESKENMTVTEKAADVANILTFGLIPGLKPEATATDGDIEMGTRRTKWKEVEAPVNFEEDEDVDLAAIAKRSAALSGNDTGYAALSTSEDKPSLTSARTGKKSTLAVPDEEDTTSTRNPLFPTPGNV